MYYCKLQMTVLIDHQTNFSRVELRMEIHDERESGCLHASCVSCRVSYYPSLKQLHSSAKERFYYHNILQVMKGNL